MKLQLLLSLTRQAIDNYHMIEDGDHIAVGLSGGKDSLTLLYALHYLQRFYPKKFALSAITVDLGLGNMNMEPIRTLCKEFAIPWSVVHTQIGPILFDAKKEANPCSLCAKMRKGALNQEAKSLGCNVIAYAHHRDDVIETLLLSLFYEGRYHCFSPITRLDRAGLSIIRPMIYVTEANVIGFKNRFQLPVCKNPCPVDGHTKRQYIKDLIKCLQKENPYLKDCLFHAVSQGSLPGWEVRS